MSPFLFYRILAGAGIMGFDSLVSTNFKLNIMNEDKVLKVMAIASYSVFGVLVILILILS